MYGTRSSGSRPAAGESNANMGGRETNTDTPAPLFYNTLFM